MRRSTLVLLALASCAAACTSPRVAEARTLLTGDVPTHAVVAAHGKQIVYVEPVVLAADVRNSFMTQAKNNTFDAEHAGETLASIAQQLEEHVYELATRCSGDLVVYDDRARAQRERTLTIRCTIQKVDLVRSKGSASAFADAISGKKSEESITFQSSVAISMVHDEQRIATGLGDGAQSVVLASSRTVESDPATAAPPETAAPATAPPANGAVAAGAPAAEPRGGVTTTESTELILSPIKDAVELAAAAAWGDAWRHWAERCVASAATKPR